MLIIERINFVAFGTSTIVAHLLTDNDENYCMVKIWKLAVFMFF